MGKSVTIPAMAADGTTSAYRGAGTNYLIQTPAGVLYFVGIDDANDIRYAKSTDGGLTWTTTLVTNASTLTVSVWYDRWSGLSTDNIHIAYTGSGSDDIIYYKLDTSTDTLTSPVTVLSATGAANGGTLSICVSRGGNIYILGCTNAGTTHGFFRSVDTGVNWTSRTSGMEGATQDQVILMPGYAADNQDMMCFFWDASADEISCKLYDDSANSWSETSIATTMVDVAATSTYPHFSACPDLTNSRNFLVAWSGVDTANADLRCFHATESAITEVTNVVLNSTDDQGLCAIGIETTTGALAVYYAGKSDGSETWNTAVKLYVKYSNDTGANWSSETSPITMNAGTLPHMFACPRFAGFPKMVYEMATLALSFNCVTSLAQPTARCILGF